MAGGSLQLDLVEGADIVAVGPLPERAVAADDVLESLRSFEKRIAAVNLEERSAEGEVPVTRSRARSKSPG